MGITEASSPLRVKAAAKSLQSCPTLWPHRRQPTRLRRPGILQARVLERAAIALSTLLLQVSIRHIWVGRGRNLAGLKSALEKESVRYECTLEAKKGCLPLLHLSVLLSPPGHKTPSLRGRGLPGRERLRAPWEPPNPCCLQTSLLKVLIGARGLVESLPQATALSVPQLSSHGR